MTANTNISDGVSGPDVTTGGQVTYPTQVSGGIREENGSVKAITNQASINLSLDTVDRDTNTQEDVDRDIDRDSVAQTEQLLDSDRELLRGCITSLQTDLCGTMFESKQELIEQADKIFDLACEMESKLKETIACQIEAAKCQFYRDLTREYDLNARIAGSSRNSFVVQQFNQSHCDLVTKLSELEARLCMDAIKEGQTALTDAYQTTSDARINGLNAAYNMTIGLWGILKGALVDATEQEHTDDVSAATSSQDMNQTHLVASYQETWSKQLQVSSNDEATFLPETNAATNSAPTIPIGL